jgi:molybdate transport system substrate-binding protein
MKARPANRLAIVFTALALICSWPAGAQAVTVFAASSLTESMNAIVKAYAARGGTAVRTSYAASSVLARQIENGAQADLFVSADEEWMTYLEKRALLEPGTRISRLGNRLVLVAPSGEARTVEIRMGLDLAGLLGRGRLAIGDPANVPAGRYARQALTALGVWPVAEPRLARAENVRMALAYVERAEVPLGIVYATDAALARGVKVVGSFPPDSHEPISYPMAILVKRARPEVLAFYRFLLGGEARAVFERFGFLVK